MHACRMPATVGIVDHPKRSRHLVFERDDVVWEHAGCLWRRSSPGVSIPRTSQPRSCVGAAKQMNRRSAGAKSHARAPFRMRYDLRRQRRNVNPVVPNVMVPMVMPGFRRRNKKQASEYDAGDAQHDVSYLTVSGNTLAVTVELRIQHNVVTNYESFEGFDGL